MSLTDATFWENYWASCKLPNVVDEGFSFDRCLSRELEKILKDCTGNVLEVGCAPGRWLAFLATRIGLKPSGIEYSKKGMEVTKENFSLLGIKCEDIWSGDFFEIPPQRTYDVVMSQGFIEHFDNATEVIEQHLLWLKPGGILVLGVPNFLGVYHTIQSILDPSLLEKHNLTIMNLDYFRRIGEEHKLKLKYLSYLGSFEPCLPIAPPGKSVPPKVFAMKAFLKIARLLRRPRFIDYFNHPYFSSYILSAYINAQ